RRNRRRRGRGLVPVRTSSRTRQEVNARVLYFLHERFSLLHTARQSFLDATNRLGVKDSRAVTDPTTSLVSLALVSHRFLWQPRQKTARRSQRWGAPHLAWSLFLN